MRLSKTGLQTSLIEPQLGHSNVAPRGGAEAEGL